jgi:Ca2+/Na+ antiporter
MAQDRWSLRNIYLYLVCLITLIMVIVGSVGVVRGVVELVYPDPYVSYERPVIEKGEDGMSEEEWERQQKLSVDSSRRYAILSLVGNGALVLIAGPLYVYHWRKIEVEHAEKPQSTPAASV